MPRAPVIFSIAPFRTERLGAAIVIAVASAISMTAPAVAQDVISPPEPLGDVSQWFSGDNYPPAAMRAGQEGRVSARLVINAEGSVTGCEITQSSGAPSLDAKTCMLAARRGRFVPAKQAGRAVASVYDLRNVEWRIRDVSVHVPSS